MPDERKQAESDGDPCSHGVGLTELRCVGYLILIPSSAGFYVAEVSGLAKVCSSRDM